MTSSFSKMQILREELDCMNTTGQTRDSVVAKMAALSGKLNLRFDAVELAAEFVSHFAAKQSNCTAVKLSSTCISLFPVVLEHCACLQNANFHIVLYVANSLISIFLFLTSVKVILLHTALMW